MAANIWKWMKTADMVKNRFCGVSEFPSVRGEKKGSGRGAKGDPAN